MQQITVALRRVLSWDITPNVLSVCMIASRMFTVNTCLSVKDISDMARRNSSWTHLGLTSSDVQTSFRMRIILSNQLFLTYTLPKRPGSKQQHRQYHRKRHVSMWLFSRLSSYQYWYHRETTNLRNDSITGAQSSTEFHFPYVLLFTGTTGFSALLPFVWNVLELKNEVIHSTSMN